MVTQAGFDVVDCGGTLQVNVRRDEALEILSQQGVLLVLCSLIDNMPYVVAEAAVSSLLQDLQNWHSCFQQMWMLSFG